MLREFSEDSTEGQIGGDLFNSRVDAFHKKITVRGRVRLPGSFNFAGGAGGGPDGEQRYTYVAADNVVVPPEIEVITTVEFEEGATVSELWKASRPPFKLYKDVHTHGPSNVSLGGIPVIHVEVG